MNKSILLILGIVAVLVVSGCAQTEKSTETSLKDIVSDPDLLLNSEVTLEISNIEEANFYDPWYSFDKIILNYLITERNLEGKPIKIYLDYEKFYCENCKISGLLKNIAVCECELSKCDGRCQLPSNPVWSPVAGESDRLVPKDICLKGSEGVYFGEGYTRYLRCKSGSENEIIFYIDVSDVISLDDN